MHIMRNSWYLNRIYPIAALITALLLSVAQAQTPADTTAQNGDTLSVSSRVKKKSALSDKIVYTADHYTISVRHNRIYLSGSARITYENMTLEAERIIIDKEKDRLYAYGVSDSVDEKGQPVWRGTPVFREKGSEPMYGERIEYDLTTQRGKIKRGRTDMDPGHYIGDEIYKVGDSTLFVRNGYFTTCDLPDNPHYYFKSAKMRVKIRDQVAAKPIVFYIADIPLAAVPFGIFPNKAGRQSGILLPSYGESRNGGRFLRGFGYYWAPSDYFDATMETDFYDKLGFTYRSQLNYKIRYKLNGRLFAEYLPVDPGTGQKRERWRLNFSHNQTIDPSFTIAGYGSFQSDKSFQRDISPNVNDRLNQLITSNLTMTKRFERSSVNVSLSRTQNLQTDESDYIFPRLSYSVRKTGLYALLGGEKKAGTRRSWYQNIYLDYSSQAIGKGSHKLKTVTVQGDSVPYDSTYFEDKTAYGIKHNARLTFSQKIGYFNFTPSVNFDEVWADEITVGSLDESGNVIKSQKKQFAARHTFNASVGVKTKLYGLFEPRIGAIKAIRHVIDPGIRFSYTPDFSDDAYGYYTYVDTDDGPVAIDKFERSPYGRTPKSRSQRMSFFFNNLFQAKTVDKDGKEKKFDLLKANFSTTYNFLADNFKWGNLTSSYSARIWGKTVSARATHSLYALDKDGNVDGGTLIFEKGQWLPRLTSFSTSFSYKLDQHTFEGALKKAENPADSAATDSTDLQLLRANMTTSALRNDKQAAKKIKAPWALNLNLNYSYSRPRAEEGVQRISLSTSANFKLTENWKIRWRANFDLVRREMVYQNIDIYRDLHCWEMSFNWQPLQGYYSFRINIKEPTLRDIKVTKYPRNSRYLRY